MAWFQRKEKSDSTAKPLQVATEKAGAASLTATPPPLLVRFPRSFIPPPSVSVTAEETGDHGSKNLWQVYALGGFMVVRWLWARWNERRGASGFAEDADYEDY